MYHHYPPLPSNHTYAVPLSHHAHTRGPGPRRAACGSAATTRDTRDDDDDERGGELG